MVFVAINSAVWNSLAGTGVSTRWIRDTATWASAKVICCSTSWPIYAASFTWYAGRTFVFRPHCSTVYVDVACCYRRSSVVCRSVCLSVTIVSPAETAEQIKMLCGLWTWVGPRNHVLGGGSDPKDILTGEMGGQLYKDLLLWTVQKRLKWSRCCLRYGLWWAQGSIY